MEIYFNKYSNSVYTTNLSWDTKHFVFGFDITVMRAAHTAPNHNPFLGAELNNRKLYGHPSRSVDIVTYLLEKN